MPSSLPQLTIVAGLPGSGKSTFLKEIENRYPEVKTFDDCLQSWYNGQAKKAIRDPHTKVVLADPRLCDPTMLDRFVKELRLDEPPMVVFIDTDPMVCVERVRHRNDGRRGVETSLWSLVRVLPSIQNPEWLSPELYKRRYGLV